MPATRSGEQPRWRSALNSSLARTMIGSVGVSVAQQGTLVVTGILTARLLGPTNRGYLALLIVVPSTIGQLGGVGIALAVTYYVARDKRHASHVLGAVRRTALIQLVGLTALHVAAVVYIIHRNPSSIVPAALLSLLFVPGALALEYGLATLQGLARFKEFNVLRVLPPVLYMLVLVILLLTDTATLATATVATVATSAAVGVVALVRSLRAAREASAADAGGPERRELMSFARRSYFGFISPIESFRLDQLYVGSFRPPADLGQYVVGVAFTNLPRFIGQSIGLIATPYIAGKQDKREQWRWTWIFLAMTCAVVGALVLVLVALVPWLIPLLFGDEFKDAVGVAQILLMGSFFLAARRALADGARGAGLPGAGSAAEISSTIWFGVALLVYVPGRSFEAVAWAFSTAAVFGFLVLAASLGWRAWRRR